jgi:hypothetical protein
LPIRTILSVDYQNAFGAAREAFHSPEEPSYFGNFDPVRLGRLLLERSADRVLTEVRIYRGRPSASHDPAGYSANFRQGRAWESAGATLIARPLRYSARWPRERPTEKGIDVALAVDFVVMALLGRYDVGILLSTDSDLEPALKGVAALAAGPYPRCEVAAWLNPSRRHPQRLSIKGERVWCRRLGPDDYKLVADPTNYRRPRRGDRKR